MTDFVTIDPTALAAVSGGSGTKTKLPCKCRRLANGRIWCRCRAAG